MPTSGLRRWTEQRDHFVVCGDSPLAHRLVDELASNLGEQVTVIVPSRRSHHAQQMSRIAGVRIIEAETLDEGAFRRASVETARSLAIIAEDDVETLHAAMRAQEVHPRLRMVLRISNNSFGNRIDRIFDNCAVLNDVSLAAPSLVAAALGERAPRHLLVRDRTCYVAPRDEVDPTRVLCTIADTREPGFAMILPTQTRDSDLVLAAAVGVGAGTAPAAVTGNEGMRVRSRIADALRVGIAGVGTVVKGRLRWALYAVFGLLLLGTVLFATLGSMHWTGAVYLALLDAAGSANPDEALNSASKVDQVAITIVGMAIIPVVTAAAVDAVVSARLASSSVLQRAPSEHVVIVGLGRVGSRVMQQLHDLGIPTLCIERDVNARGIGLARRLGVPVVIGDAGREETLRNAAIGASQALLALTRDDLANIESVLTARAVHPDLRVVLRLFDDNLADLAQRNLHIDTSRSVSSLAAPAFAAAMVDRTVIATIPLERRKLLIAEVAVGPGSPLVGEELESLCVAGESQVIALRLGDAEEVTWSPEHSRLLEVDDHVIVIVEGEKLGRLLARSIAPPEELQRSG